jgi:DNA-binding winged helix-turn-helix (wHTH) protein
MKTVVSAAGEVAELLNEAAARGHLVIVRTSPPPDNARTPLLLTLNQIFQLSPAEGRALVALMEHGHVSRQAIHAAMSGDGNPVSKTKIIDVVVSRMRRKLAPHGLAIVTIYGLGFKLGEGAHDRIRRLLAEHNPELVLEHEAVESKDNTKPHVK